MLQNLETDSLRAIIRFWSDVRYIEYKDWWDILNITLYDECTKRYLGLDASLAAAASSITAKRTD